MSYLKIAASSLPPGWLKQTLGIPWYASGQINDTSPVIEPGSAWTLQDRCGCTNKYVYMKILTNNAATQGQIFTRAIPITGDSITNTTGMSASVDGTTTYFGFNCTGPYTAGDLVGSYVWIATPGVMRLIKANTSTSITFSQRDFGTTTKYDADALTSAPSGAIEIIRHRTLALCDATHVPVGVALGACGNASADHYSVVQYGGLALVSMIGNGTALVVNTNAIVGASANILGVAGPTYQSKPMFLPQIAYNGAGAVLPCIIDLPEF